MKKWSDLSKAALSKTGSLFAEAQATSDRARLNLVEGDLAMATRNWTSPMVMRSYGSGDDDALRREAQVFGEHGYEASMQSEDGGHVHVGRLLLTGGLSMLAGQRGVRSGGKRTLTWQRPIPSATSGAAEVIEQVRQLGALRDAGLITTEEFEAKKADLLGRL